MATYAIAVLEDAIQVLEVLQQSNDGVSLAEITEKSGLVKNKVFRILFTLEKHHMVGRDKVGRYHLGLRFLEFGQQVQSQTILLEASRSVMDQLVKDTGETIFLGVIDSGEALCVAARESPQSVRLFARVGRRAPLYLGGVPKTLCAFLPNSERNRLLDGFNDADVDRDELELTLTHIREQGYVVVIDELDMGAHSIAAPIRDYRGQVIAAISIAGPSHRFTAQAIDRYVQLILEAATEISDTLGYKAGELNGSRINLLPTY